MPQIRPVGAADAKLPHIGLARRHAIAPMRAHPRHIIGMDRGGPGGIVEFPGRQPDIAVGAAVEPVGPAIGRRRPHMVGHGFGKQLQLRHVAPHLGFRAHPAGDVRALDEYPDHRPVGVAHRLIHQVDKPLFRLRLRLALQQHPHPLPHKRLAGGIGLVQQFVKSLPRQLRQPHPHRQPQHIAMPAQLHIGGIGQLEHVIGPRQHRHEARRLLEHLPQPVPLARQPALRPQQRRRLVEDHQRPDHPPIGLDDG